MKKTYLFYLICLVASQAFAQIPLDIPSKANSKKAQSPASKMQPNNDQAGLVNMKNKLTILGSCQSISTHLHQYTNMISNDIMYTDGGSLDDKLARRNEIIKIGQQGDNVAKILSEVAKSLPYDQYQIYDEANMNTTYAIQDYEKTDPQKVLSSYMLCKKIYSFR